MSKSKEKLVSIVVDSIKKGYVSSISISDLRKQIMQTLGVIDDRSVNKWLNAILALDFATQPHPFNYKWNYAVIGAIPQVAQLRLDQVQEANR